MLSTQLMAAVTACVICVVCCGSASALEPTAPQPGKQVQQHFSLNENESMGYWVYLPEGYEPEKKYPLVIFMHGRGERGDDLTVVLKHGPPRMVQEGKQFPFILISPQLSLKHPVWVASDVLKLVDHAEASYAVDQNRIYATGLSLGGGGTWAVGLAAPDRFAALLPICGKIDPKFPSQVKAIKHVPVWAFHGDADTAVPISETIDMVEGLKAVDGNVKFTTYPGVAHDSWSRTYSNPEVYQWLLQHSLNR